MSSVLKKAQCRQKKEYCRKENMGIMSSELKRKMSPKKVEICLELKKPNLT
jgi:hypothetical protein